MLYDAERNLLATAIYLSFIGFTLAQLYSVYVNSGSTVLRLQTTVIALRAVTRNDLVAR